MNVKPETGKKSLQRVHGKSGSFPLTFQVSHFRFPPPFSLCPHAEHDAGGGARAVHGDGVVNFVEREGMGDKAVEGHFAGLDEVDEAGNLKIGAALPP